MSFIARRFLSDTIEDCVAASELTPAEQKLSYYCPGCSCEYRFRSASSNMRAAHFFKYGAHDPACWMSDAESITGDVSWESTHDFDLDNFFDSITQARSRSGDELRQNGGGSKNPTQMHLSTIRNLYKFCCYHSNDTMINDKIAVKDILVSRKTMYLYTTYVKGIHLIEAHFWRYVRNSKTLHFYYPYSAAHLRDARFEIIVYCSDDIFENLKRKVFAKKDKVILIMCDWSCKNGTITGAVTNLHQLVIV